MHTCKMQKKEKKKKKTDSKISSSDTLYIFHTGEETIWAPMMLCTFFSVGAYVYFCLFVNNCQRNCQRLTFIQISFFLFAAACCLFQNSRLHHEYTLQSNWKICVLNWNIEPIRPKWLWTGLGWQQQAYSGTGNPIYCFTIKKEI